MKKALITIALLSGVLILNSCKSDKKTAGENTTETVNANQEVPAAIHYTYSMMKQEQASQ